MNNMPNGGMKDHRMHQKYSNFTIVQKIEDWDTHNTNFIFHLIITVMSLMSKIKKLIVIF
jgi:hypothetical protein